MRSVTYQQGVSAVYELSGDGTKMPKHLGVVERHTVQGVCNLCVNLVL
jgi:hypothetical protein